MKRIISSLTSTTLLLIIAVLPCRVFSQNIKLNSEATAVQIKENTYQKIVFSSTISDIGSMEVTTPEGVFSVLSIEGFGLRNISGQPALPVYRQLIEVPFDATFAIRVIRQNYREIDLTASGVNMPVMPAQPPLSKGDDPSKVAFMFDKKLYAQDSYIEDQFASISPVGVMRALNLARVDISPVQYNPVQHTLRVYDILEVEIVFENANIPKTIALKESKASPYFNSMYQMVGNYKTSGATKNLITSAPATYVIVSDPMFQTILQPFVQWKTRKGFKVIEAYTNNPSVGTTTTTIKAYLQGLYNSPPTGYNSPSFVLFVGDVAQIPAWNGSAGSHYTDLRYCEYTGDNLPEVYYGRFSATNITQLQPQIDKTLEYEQYLMPDPSFLNEAVMVAGADGSYQTHSNGQINYGTENYFNASHNIVSHTYLQPEPSGAGYSQSIKANVSSGVAYANYTAHCSESGWGNPSFVISDIANLTNAHKYCLMVGNCCLSAKFDVNSFAEEQLRAANKGSVGYIGGSNNTYWDEDYYWGCGFKSVVLHPAYDANHIGAYDGTFHDHGEPTEDWFVTQGQMVVCGNYAVEESSSSRKTYYWEIYHLMGDPSLMIYYSVPSALSATYQNTLMIGMTTLAVNTEAYATVALSNAGVLLDAKVADASGVVNLSFPALSSPGNLDMVITKQNRQPHIGIIQVIPASGPYIVYAAGYISDPLPNGNNNGLMDFGETDLLNISLKNVGVATANNVVATLSTSDTYITIIDNIENYGNIAPDQTVTQTNAFSFTVANNIPDQHLVAFDLSATNGTDIWVSHFNITANAPVLSVGTLIVQDNSPGCNNDGILDPGETANLVIACSNSGHSSLSGISGSLSIIGGTSPYLTLNSNSFIIGTLAAGGTGNAVFSVTANASTPIGTPVDLQFSVSGGSYNDQESKQVVIGLIPTYNMSNTTVNACVGNFYDPGGSAASYSDNLNITETFYPSTPGASIRFTFNSFATESGYDYLKIYNGTSTTDPLIGTYSGATGPGTITASNASGALTFNFTSDGSVVAAGWSASISCYSNTVPPVAAFTVSSNSPAINSTVTFTDQSTDMPTFWAWTFSPNTIIYMDGTYAGSQNPQVQFMALGQYSVTLIATNAYGTDDEVKTNLINVTPFTYCIPTYTNGTSSNDYITLVQLGTINNVTGASASPYYTYYSNLSTDLNPGSAYTITLSPGTYTSGNNISVWIDYNQNGTFETSEKLGNVSIAPTPATGAINFTVPETATPGITRMRVREVWNNNSFDACSSYSYGETEDYNINILGQDKTLNLTLFLEGLFNGSSMNKAQNAIGNQFPGNVADQITVELRNPTAPYALAAGPYTLDLKTDGTTSVTIPGSLSGSYFVVVKHRNSIETWTNSPVLFIGSAVDYNFSTSANMAYGSNLKLVLGKFVIYSGDINQDGNINDSDIAFVGNDAFGFMCGYIGCDVNGDGVIDSRDLIFTDNNASAFVGCIKP